MPRSINFKGTDGKEYNLEELENSGTRTDGTKPLSVQVWYWNPEFNNSHKNPNPPDITLQIGNIWLSKFVDAATYPKEYNETSKIVDEMTK